MIKYRIKVISYFNKNMKTYLIFSKYSSTFSIYSIAFYKNDNFFQNKYNNNIIINSYF